MTLIAQLSINGAPLMIGDVLLSSEQRTGLRVTLPLVGDINEVLAKNGVPFQVDFSQKVNVLSDRLVVAWSGRMDEAERALRVLSQVAARPNLELDDIGRELNAIDPQQIAHLQLVGTLLGETQGAMRAAHCFTLGVKAKNIPTLGPVFAAGTGRDFFLNLLGRSNWTNYGTGTEFQVAHGLLAALTNEEYRTGSTILNRWGGGFEAVTCSQLTGQFEKVGDILHTFWKMREHEDDSLAFTPMFYKTTYWRDALIIRSVRLNETSSETFQIANNDLVLIPPLLKQASDYDLNEMGHTDFGYRAICCHIVIEKSESRDLVFFVEQRERQRNFSFEFDGSLACVHISSDLTTAIIDEVERSNSTETAMQDARQ